MFLYINFLILINIITRIHSTAEGTVQEALDILKNKFSEDLAIRQFFYENIVERDRPKYCGKPSNCADLLYLGFTKSGPYKIYPLPWMKQREMTVYCDMETDGGGWTLFQRRGEFGEPHINFTRGWSQYSEGFGNLTEEFWLGNENIHLLSTQDNVLLKIELEDFDGNKREATYGVFEVGSKDELYKMRVEKYKGNAGDGFGFTNGAVFVSIDRDNSNKCAEQFKGGWWYVACHASNLNGRYLHGNHTSFADGINWHPWLGHHYSLKRSEMKIRPKAFQPS